MITEIAFSAYPAADVRKLRDWYRDTLGLKFESPFEENGTLMYDEADAGKGNYFSLMTVQWTGAGPGTGSGVVFETNDLDGAKADLTARGVETEDVYDTPVCRLFTFSDPEGNKLTLHQHKK